MITRLCDEVDTGAMAYAKYEGSLVGRSVFLFASVCRVLSRTSKISFMRLFFLLLEIFAAGWELGSWVCASAIQPLPLNVLQGAGTSRPPPPQPCHCQQLAEDRTASQPGTILLNLRLDSSTLLNGQQRRRFRKERSCPWSSGTQHTKLSLFEFQKIGPDSAWSSLCAGHRSV